MNKLTSEQTTDNQYLSALMSIAMRVIEETQRIAKLYQEQNLAIEPADIVRLYCRWLGYVIRQKIVGDKKNLSKLTTDTIQKNTSHGAQLCQIVQSSTKENNLEIDTLVSSAGLMVIPILKLTQFISNSVAQNLNRHSQLLTKEERGKVEADLDPILYEIFENWYVLSLQEITNLQIENPLIFLLEHFSIMVGWLMGFFAELNHKLINHSANENIIRDPIEVH